MTTADENNLDPDAPSSGSSEREQPSRNSSSGEACIYCPTGNFEPGETTMTLERNGTTLVVKQVPGQVCWACGEALLAEETVENLQEMMERAVAAEVETAVRSYEAQRKSSSTSESASPEARRAPCSDE